MIALAVLAGAGLSRPLGLWNTNRAQGLQASELLVIAASAILIGLLVALTLRSVFGLHVIHASVVAGVMLIALYHWEGLDDPIGQDIPWIRAAILAASMALVWLAARATVVRSALAASLVVFSLVPALYLGVWAIAARPHSVHVQAPPRLGGTGNTPDIFLIVLDGYARHDILQELFQFDNGRFLGELERAGFKVADEAWSNYSMTYASIPSMLTLGYPLLPHDVVDEAMHRALNRLSGGDNPLVRALKRLGYEYVHIESGMGQTRCGPEVDICVRAPALDETVWGLLARTPLGELLGTRWGYFAEGGLHALRGLERVMGERSDKPRFIFGHVLLPHPPLMLDRSCDERVTLDDVVLGTPERRAELAVYRRAYVQQLACVNMHVGRLLREMDPSAVGALVADHGPDSLSQLWTDIERWDDRQLRERMAVLAAYKLPERCTDELAETTVNGLRLLLGCTLGGNLPPLPDRRFVVPRPLAKNETIGELTAAGVGANLDG